MTIGDLTTALPTPRRWDFGGHPYGLEPLLLPASAPDPASVDAQGFAELESSSRSLLDLGAAGDGSGPPMPDPVERIFWFRWITGHQTTFVLWQLLAQAKRRAANDPAAAEDALESCRVFVRGCSTMLIYTGSCPRNVYHRVIRPSMALQHPGFSGSWARDFRPVHGVLSARALTRAPDTSFGRECTLNGIIHQGIADKLVPDAPSLLQETTERNVPWHRSALSVLYDTYFLTLRGEISYASLVSQMMRRLHAIGHDIAANGLYPPYASSAAEKPPCLRTEQVEDCERSIPETLFAIATRATASVPSMMEVT